MKTDLLRFGLCGFLLFCIFPKISLASGVCVMPPTNLVGWWPGDNNFTDISGDNLNGLQNGSVSFVGGKVGDAFSFNGNAANFVQIGQNSVLESQQISIDAWVLANGSPGNFRYIISKGAQAENAASYALYTGNSGGLLFYVSDGSNFALSPDAGSGIWDNTWHHVVGTYDGANISLYVDGTLIGTNTANITINYNLSSQNDLLIGTYSDFVLASGTNYAFNGAIDEVEIFNRVLSAEEISNIYGAGENGKCNASIDIVPVGHGSCFVNDGHGFLPAIIFGSTSLDVSLIDLSTLFLNGLPVAKANNHFLVFIVDDNADGLPDLRIWFKDIAGTFVPGPNEIVPLIGSLLDGTQIRSEGELCVLDKPYYSYKHIQN